MTDEPAIRRLTLQESRVARLVAEGRSDAEIAQRLAISVVEVTADLADIFRKLGLRSRTELALLAPDGSPARPMENPPHD